MTHTMIRNANRHCFIEKFFGRHRVLGSLMIFVGIPLLICAAMLVVSAPFVLVAAIS